MANIKKIKLSNGEIYSIFDNGALRLNAQNQLICGNSIVDELIIKGGLSITEIDDVPVTDSINNVLVQDASTGKIMKRSTDALLEDIGGYSCKYDNGVLSLQVGKQA